MMEYDLFDVKRIHSLYSSGKILRKDIKNIKSKDIDRYESMKTIDVNWNDVMMELKRLYAEDIEDYIAERRKRTYDFLFGSVIKIIKVKYGCFNSREMHEVKKILDDLLI